MKIRNGFVSNSSSSSFIIPNGDISKISNKMLEIIINDRDHLSKKENKIEYNKLSSNLNKALKRKDVKSGKVGIFIGYSCNYDTYIILKEGDLYITTSNNYVFDIGTDKEYSIKSNDIYKVIKDGHYYNIDHKIIHSHSKDDEFYQCNKCKLNYGMCFIDFKGNVLCSECCAKMSLSKKGEDKEKEDKINKKNKEKFSKNAIFSINLKD